MRRRPDFHRRLFSAVLASSKIEDFGDGFALPIPSASLRQFLFVGLIAIPDNIPQLGLD